MIVRKGSSGRVLNYARRGQEFNGLVPWTMPVTPPLIGKAQTSLIMRLLIRTRERAKYAAILLFIDFRDITIHVHLLLPSQVPPGGMGLQKIPQR